MQAEREVDGMIHSRTPFDVIEDQIQAIPGLVDDERSALWLYAWSRQGRTSRPGRGCRGGTDSARCRGSSRSCLDAGLGLQSAEAGLGGPGPWAPGLVLGLSATAGGSA